MDYQRITYEQLMETQHRQDELAHQILGWSQRFERRSDAYHVLMEAYTRLYEDASNFDKAMAQPLDWRVDNRQAGHGLKSSPPQVELEAFLLSKQIEAQVNLGTHPDEIDELWIQWGMSIQQCDESPTLREITATVFRSLAVCHAAHLQSHLAATHYDALMELAQKHPQETVLLQEWSKAVTELADLYANQKDIRRARQLYDDLMDCLPQAADHDWLRLNLVRTARHVVWAYREHEAYDRPVKIAQEALDLCNQHPDDLAIRREMARLWVCLSYGYGHRRQWRKSLPLFRTLNDWIRRWPTDRYLRLRWMQVARNLVWGHDGQGGLKEVEQVFEAMVSLQAKHPQQAALRTELGWSCVNMSWSYGTERPARPEALKKVVETTRRLQQVNAMDVELAECYAATCRNWLWSLRDEPETEPEQAQAVDQLRQILKRFPKEAYIRKQTVACLVNYSYVAKVRLDSQLLMRDLDWIQRLTMEFPHEDYLAQALSEVASNLIETYQEATDAEEPKVYLALISGLLMDRPGDSIILGSLACAASETAWICEKARDLVGAEQCVALMESYQDRYPANAELGKSHLSASLALLTCLVAQGQLERAFEVHLRVRYQARRNPTSSFHRFCWGRSCEQLILAHPHHQFAGPYLPLLLGELDQLHKAHPEDGTITEFWVNGRIHLIWRSLGDQELEASEEEAQRLVQLLANHPQREDLVPYLQKVMLTRLWVAAQRQDWADVRLALADMSARMRQYPQWVSLAQTLAQAGVVALTAYHAHQQVREADWLLDRLARTFSKIRQVYVQPEDAIVVWDQLSRVALVWQLLFGHRSEGSWWARQQHQRRTDRLARLGKDPLSQCILWSWVNWRPKSCAEDAPTDLQAIPLGIHQRRLTNLMQVLRVQHPHDEVLQATYKDWLALLYQLDLVAGQTEQAAQTFSALRQATAEAPGSFRLKSA